MSASRGADGLSRGRYVYARPSVRIHVYVASHAHSRRTSCAKARRKAHAHHAVDQPARAVPGNFCCATERPSRNLAYARLANQPATDVSSTRGTLHRRRAAPRRRQQQRTRYTPERTNVRSPRFLARARALVQPNEPPYRRWPSRVEPNRVQFRSRGVARGFAISYKSANFYHHRHLETRRDATRRNETSRRAPPLHPLALSTLASLTLAPPPPHPTQHAPRAPPTRSRRPARYHLSPLFLSSFRLRLSHATTRVSPLRMRNSPYPSLHPLYMLLLLHVSPRKERLSRFLSHSYCTSCCPRSMLARPVHRISLLFVLLWPSPSITLPNEKGHLLSPLCSHALGSGEPAARFARLHDALVSRASFSERTLLPSYPRSLVSLLKSTPCIIPMTLEENV